MKAKRFFFLVMAICLAIGVRAQFSSNDEVLLYIPAGESIESCNASKVPVIVRFNNGNADIDMRPMYFIKNVVYKEDSTLKKVFHYNLYNTYNYDEDNTTSKRITYSRKDSHFSFSPDKKSLIKWVDETQPKYFIRVDLSELAPKPINKDFLYE